MIEGLSAFEEIQLHAQLGDLDERELAALARRALWKRKLARPNQLPPAHQDWDYWILLAGRGFGKTRTAVEWLWWEAWCDPGSYNHVVVRRSEDLQKVAFEGPSGLFRITPPEIVAHATRSPYKLVLTNGSVILGFSADDPDVLRGPEAHRTWCDELAAWRRLDAAWNDGVLFGTRLGSERNRNRPKVVITTTPRPVKILKEIRDDPGTIISTGTTFDNAKNLPPKLLENLRKKFAGTRRGKQELEGIILDDVPGALFSYPNIENHRVWEAPTNLRQVVVAVDPPASSNEGSNECGIVAGGVDREGRGFILRDKSDIMSPDVWGREAVLLHDELQADHITIEVNQGGEMCQTVLQAAAERLWREGQRKSRDVVVRMVRASRGKEIRAEPVSQLYENGFVSHVGEFEQLEDQMIHFTKDYDRKRDGSPDRLDAMVWLITDLLVEAEPDISDALLHTLDRNAGWKFGTLSG